MALDSFKQVAQQGDVVTARAYHNSVVYNNRLYVLMGYNGVARLGDMFYTSDGIHWKNRAAIYDTKGNTISARTYFGLCEHNEKVYLVGGHDGSYKNDVYVTSDMVRFKRLKDAPWTGRSGFACLSFDERLWVIGGTALDVNVNEVWWTRDGVNWVQEPNATWTGRTYHASIVYNNKIYIIGGNSGANYYGDVYYTSDCKRWVRMESNAAFSSVANCGIASFGNHCSRMVIVGGQIDATTYSDNLWHSGNGNQWLLGDSVIPMGNIRSHSMNWLNNKLLVVGGLSDAASYKNEVWEANNQLFAAK